MIPKLIASALVALGLGLATTGTASADQGDYDMGYAAGLAQLEMYPNATTKLQLRTLCANAYRSVVTEANQISQESGYKTIVHITVDYMVGCFAAVGAK